VLVELVTRGQTLKRALLSPLTSIAAATLSLATLAIALRLGEAPALVAYGVGMSIGGILSVILSGGSALAFITGNLATQAAVRSFRLRFVLPVTVVATAIASYVYSSVSGISAIAILFGGMTAVLAISSELEAAYLRRKLKTMSILTFEISSRALGLALVLVTVDYSLALFIAAAVRYAGLYYSARKDPSRQLASSIRLSQSFGPAVRPPLLASSFLYVVLDRVSFIVLPFLVDESFAGYFVAMMSGQQAVAGALASGLQTSMASRAEARTEGSDQNGSSWHKKFELIVVAASLSLAVIALILQAPLLIVLAIPMSADVRLMWSLIMVALPLATAARATQYSLLSGGRSGSALVSISAAVSVILCLSIAALLLGVWQLVVGGILAAETIAFAVGVCLLATDRRKLTPGASG